MKNPLLVETDCNQLPNFAAIQATHFKPAIEALIATAERDIDKILGALQGEPPGWENFCAPLESALDRLE
ncbi:MAG: hypothetical protein HKO07_04870, partial [Pseudomonadales bacterium]|nr:hypothetical protein [Pseudomonadales bacterium]